jgi:Vault protein inter-alpha-trypsin domain/von Willebrand factor type A domain
MTRRSVSVLVVGLSLVPALAHGDALYAALDGKLREVSHTVAIRIDGGVARYVVRRELHNDGARADEARLVIELPYGAAASGLRIQAKDRWFDGDLLERAEAAQRYQELTGAGIYDPKDPALLHWSSSHELVLQVFPVLPGQSSTVEYTLTGPTRYAAGQTWVSYPRVEPVERLDREGHVLDERPPGWTSLPLALPAITVEGAGAITADGAPITGRTFTLAAGSAEPTDGASPIAVADAAVARRGYDAAQLVIEVAHPDLALVQLELVTPGGERLPVYDGGDGAPLGTHHEIALPHGTPGSGTWQLRAISASPALGTIERWSLRLGGATFASRARALIPEAETFEVAANQAMIAIAPPPIATWTARYGRVVASDAHAFGRLELDVAPRLSELPRRAQVVFVIDASYSVGAERLDAELAIVRAYARDLPDAEIELVAYRRKARRVFGRMVPATELPRALDDARRRGRFALGNGSALDDGARLAAEVLAGRAGPHRIVIETDGAVRRTLDEAQLRDAVATLDPGAVVHVVVPSLDDEPALRLARDDSAPLAVIATAHHGIFAELRGFAAARAGLAEVVRQLVRPLRLEQVVATAGGLSVPETLEEGSGVRLWSQGTRADTPAELQLSAALWSDRVRLQLRPDAALAPAIAAFGFGAQLFEVLTEAEQMTLARLGRVVSPVTSYLAIEPGVRPSKIGLPAGGGTGWGTIGTGRYGTIGQGIGGGGTPALPDLAALIDQRPCLRAHPAGDAEVQLEVETTRDEIVDVSVLAGAGPLAACLVEATWAVRLDARFDRDDETYVFTLGR